MSRAPLLHELEEVVHGEVALGAQERVQDHLALLAALEAVLDQVSGEDLLFLAADFWFHGKRQTSPRPRGPVNAFRANPRPAEAFVSGRSSAGLDL